MITEPVVPTQAPQRTSSVSRRQIAVIAAVAVLAAAMGLVFGLSVMDGRGSSLAPAAGYVNSGSLMYLEADLSLAASQEDALRAILARFPGTDPDAVSGDGLAAALDEALDQGEAPFDYSNDIAPWFEGTVAVTVLDEPLDPDSARPPATGGVLLGVSDAGAATSLADSVGCLAEADGGSFSSSDAGGVTVWTLDVAPASRRADMEAGFAYALTDDQLVLGTSRATVEALLAVHRGGADSLADRNDVSDLADRLPANQGRRDERWTSPALMASMRDQLGATDTELRDLLDRAAGVAAGRGGGRRSSFEDDAIRVDGAMTCPPAIRRWPTPPARWRPRCRATRSSSPMPRTLERVRRRSSRACESSWRAAVRTASLTSSTADRGGAGRAAGRGVHLGWWRGGGRRLGNLPERGRSAGARRQPVRRDDRSGDPTTGVPGAAWNGTRRQGFVEESNVSVVEEMVDMILGQRACEANSGWSRPPMKCSVKSTTWRGRAGCRWRLTAVARSRVSAQASGGPRSRAAMTASVQARAGAAATVAWPAAGRDRPGCGGRIGGSGARRTVRQAGAVPARAAGRTVGYAVSVVHVGLPHLRLTHGIDGSASDPGGSAPGHRRPGAAANRGAARRGRRRRQHRHARLLKGKWSRRGSCAWPPWCEAETSSRPGRHRRRGGVGCATALQSGSVGDVIRLVNPASRRQLRGRITGKSAVEVQHES